jgi:hypothetical protein
MTSDEQGLSWRGYGLMLSVVLSTAAFAAPPADSSTPPPADPPATGATPDDSLLEFLGSDDVGDARWWDYLMKTAPRTPPPQTPAQEADK